VIKPLDIECQAISKTYGYGDSSIKALENISFSVRQGEMICIVGPTGSGKSTLLRILLGFVEPTDGFVRINEHRKRNGIAYIQQDSQLLPWRTVIQNAALGREFKGHLRRDDLLYLRAELEKFDLLKFAHAKCHELSGGMRQKVALVRALASRPRILLCDEPFSAIDFVGRLEMNNLFKTMCRLESITTVLVTHNIEEAIFLGDHIVVLSTRPGRILAKYEVQLTEGAYDAVLVRQSPEFQRLFADIWEKLRNG
jgi:NitT/TauT family transport system ATP-binding protein